MNLNSLGLMALVSLSHIRLRNSLEKLRNSSKRMHLRMAEPGGCLTPKLLSLYFGTSLSQPPSQLLALLFLPLALTTAYRLSLPCLLPTSLASASAAPSTTSSTSGISTHCPTSCGPRLHAGLHICSGTGCDNLGMWDGRGSSPSPG